ncbi:MAG: putative N-formylglutamate amidohydrolase [Paracoccaceae bacterium]|jgi:predicted N-formylglutamate amidohydrolase
MSAMSAYEIFNPDGAPALLLLCDHASNAVPDAINGGDLGLPPEDMARHIAYDVGARGVTLALARLMDAPAVLSTFSRLVIDPNRGEDDPTLVMQLYDGSVIPANRHAGHQEVEARLDAWHRPYHRAIRAQIIAAQARLGGAAQARLGADVSGPALLSIHSYTPQLRGRPPRPWHAGVLWDRDPRLAVPLIELLRAEPDLVVGDNEPYEGHLAGDTMWEHGTLPGLPHALLEIRNDLIETEAQQIAWAERLLPIVRAAMARIPAA